MTNASYSKFDVFASTLTKDSWSTSNSDFSYSLGLPRNVPYSNVSIISAKISKTYYTVDATNNVFTFNQEGVDNTITIPIGFYTAGTLLPEIQTLLNAIGGGVTYVVVFVSLTGLVTIQGTGNTVPFIVKASTSALPYLGVLRSTNISSSGAYLWTSPNVISVNRTSSLHIRSNIVDSNQNETLLSLFDVNSFANGVDIIYESNDVVGKCKKVKNINNTSFNFSLLDDYGANVNLNGGNIQLSLAVWV